MYTHPTQMDFRSFLAFASLLLTGFFAIQTNRANAQAATESTFFQQTGAQRGYAMCPSPDGNLYLAGQRNELLLLMKMNREGVFLSSFLLDLSLGPAAAVAEIIVDSDGKIVGCGNFGEDAPGNSFVFRYDTVTASVLWVKTLEGNNTLLSGVVEAGPAGHFLAYGNPHTASGDDAEILCIDRNTGKLLPGASERYHLGGSDNINAMLLHNGSLYATGRYTDGSDYGDMRHALTKFDVMSFAPQWSRLSHVDSNKTARLYGRDLLIDQGSIISTYSGNDNGDLLDPTFVFLQKTTLDGELIWVKKYDLAEWNTEFAEEIVSVPDGYVLLGRTFVEEQGWLFLLKTDKNGKPLWAQKFMHEYNNDLVGAAQGQLLALGNYLYFTGYTEHVPTNSKMFVVKTDAEGKISPSCTALEATPVTATDISNPVNYAIDLAVSTSPAQLFDITQPVPINTTLTKLVICEQEGMSDCQNMVDWELIIDGLTCDQGKLSLHYKLCNIGGAAATDSVPVVFYLGNPTTMNAPVLGAYTFDGILAAGECKSGVLEDLAQVWFPNGLSGAQTVYAVINDNGSLAPPFSLDSFPVTNLPECNYTNNSAFTVVAGDDSPVLELGPDVISCTGDPVTFNAGSGFYQYLWQDGSTDSTLTVTEVGIYSVEVTDVCGFRQRDSVFYTFSLLPDTQFPDTVICPGTALVYSAPGFDTYAWLPAAGLSCTDCPTVTAQPAVTTQYTLIASDSAGCVLIDTFLIEVLPLPQPSVVTINCPANLTVTIPDDMNTAVVTYTAPTVSTDCPCGDVSLTLEQGFPSGAAFPADNTLVCYTAEDDCGTASSCCFTVTVKRPPGDEVCDVKITPCIKFEIMGIFQNPAKQKTYRMRVTNNCANKLEYVAFQLPDAYTAIKPADNTTYNAPSGRSYLVRNPNLSPFRSIRFKTTGAGISGGQSDIFEYTLPAQTSPTFIHAIVRLEPQTYYETHLNVFGCEVQQTPNRPDAGKDRYDMTTTNSGLRVFPNPATDMLYLDLSAWTGVPIQLRVFDALGRVKLEQKITADEFTQELNLTGNWPTGWYCIEVIAANGERQIVRFLRVEH